MNPDNTRMVEMVEDFLFDTILGTECTDCSFLRKMGSTTLDCVCPDWKKCMRVTGSIFSLAQEIKNDQKGI